MTACWTTKKQEEGLAVKLIMAFHGGELLCARLISSVVSMHWDKNRREMSLSCSLCRWKVSSDSTKHSQGVYCEQAKSPSPLSTSSRTWVIDEQVEWAELWSIMLCCLDFLRSSLRRGTSYVQYSLHTMLSRRTVYMTDASSANVTRRLSTPAFQTSCSLPGAPAPHPRTLPRSQEPPS